MDAGLAPPCGRRSGGWGRRAAPRARRRPPPARRGRPRSSGSGSAPAGRRAARPRRPPARIPAASAASCSSGSACQRCCTAAIAERLALGRPGPGRRLGRVRGDDQPDLLHATTVATDASRTCVRTAAEDDGAMGATIDSTPAADGFRMPGEFEPHDGCWMAWPRAARQLARDAGPAQEAFAAVAAAIAASEPVTMGASAAQLERARALLPPSVRVVELASDDAWMRDIGPSFVVDGDRRPARRRLALQRLGRDSTRPGSATNGSPARSSELEGADRYRRTAGARGRLDPRRRRGHGADHRRVPAQPQPQPGAEPRARSSRRCSTTSAPRR